MNTIFQNSTTIGLVISLISYMIGLKLKKTLKWSFLNPLLISIILTILFVLVFRVDYDSFNASARYLSYLLTPATVSLAIPLYLEIDRLKKNWKAIIISIFAGTVTSLAVIIVMGLIFRFSHSEIVTFLPKSITTAIGMSVSEELGGIVSITVAAIIVTGIFGAVIADTVFKLFHITDPVAQGLAIGTSAHAIGTSRAMEIGPVQGAMSSLAIVTAGIITVILAPLLASLF